ncbi:MAG: hypothetical protein ACLTT3_02900 [Roseburia faecis]
MAIAGRVAIVPKNDYDASLTYKRLDAVMHNNTLYIAKKDVPAGKVPGADTKGYWMSGPSAGASAPATTTSNGLMSATDKKAIEVLKKPLATCATGRATAAKAATLANFTLQVGATIAVKFTNTAGTANPASGNLTLNVNGTGAKTIGYFRNGNKSALTYASGGFFCNNATHIFTYDGVYWLCMDWNADNNTTYSNFVKSGAGAKAGLVPAPSTTAGTSKYLREDGTWQTPPGTKTSVVNNQTTTVAGYALDARQANPNLDGTLAKQISDLNGSLNSKKIPSFGIENIFTGNPFCIVNNGSDVISVQTDWDIDNGGYRVKDIKYPAGTATNLTVSLSLPANSIVIVDVNALNGENIDIQGSLIRCNLSNSASVWNLSIRFTGRTSNHTLSDIRYMPLVIHLG